VVLLSSIGVDAAAAHRKAASGGTCVLIQPPCFTRQSFEAHDTLRALQRLIGRGSVFDGLVESTRDERHCDWSWNGRQRLKRGVSPNSGTPSR
jgi:hypothetical protein